MGTKTDKKSRGIKKRKPSQRTDAPKAQKRKREHSWRIPAIIGCVILFAIIVL